MNPENNNYKIPKLFDLILSFFIVLLFVLSKIGDAVIWIFKRPGVITIQFIKTIILRLSKIKFSFDISFSLVSLLRAVFSFSLGVINILRQTLFSLVKFLVLVISLIGKTTLLIITKITSLRFPKIKFSPALKKAEPQKKDKIIYKIKKPRFSFYSFILGITITLIFILIPFNLYNFLKSLPNPKVLAQNHYPVTTKIYDRNNNLLYEIYADQNRTPVKLGDVPRSLLDATIAIEDKEFYYHFGFSARGITRALKSIIENKDLQGGSTITQQLIKSALLTPERTVQRKIREILLAFWAERLYTKDQILEMYLNQVPYGGTAWGIQAAAETYFGKNVSDLTLAESALLAGLPAAPTYYSPFGAHPENAEFRKNQVLGKMLHSGKITKDEYEEAIKEKINYAPQITNIKAPHFVMYVRELLERKYGIRKVEQGGLRVVTSLDLTLQEKAQEILTRQIEELKPLSVGNGAALITNPKTGEILSMVGSKNYFDLEAQGNVNIATSLRQPGSSIKVVTYAAALENGFTPVSILNDSPISYSIAGQKPYTPVNYDSKFHGKITLRKALGNSYNIPAVKVFSQIGLEKMIAYGQNMGIESWTDTSRYGLSLTLGGGEVTMLDMARVYDTLANKGQFQELNPILKVTTFEEETLEENKENPGKQAIKTETAFLLSNILADNDARSDAFGPNSKLVIPGKTVSVKTGTSNEKRDNWAIGFTPSYVVTTWVGNNDNTPMNPVLTSGVTGATPIWNEIMNYLLKDKNDETYPVPDNIISMPCYGKVEYFVTGSQPVGGCPIIIQDTPTPTPTP